MYSFEQNKEQKEAWDRFRRLPQDIQDALFAMESSEAVREIGRKNALHIDQMGSLANLLGDTMLGYVSYTNFREEVQKRLRLDNATTERVVADTNDLVFAPIRESLKRVVVRAEEDVPNQETSEAGSRAKAEPKVGSGTQPDPDPFSSKLEGSIRTENREERIESAPVNLSPEKSRPYNKDPYREPVE